MTRRELLQTLGSSAAASRLTAFPQGNRRNIVMILMDDLGWSDTGVYGSRFYETPNIDRLARQGIRFTEGYAACPVCSPTRASVMTGKYPARLGVTNYLPGKHQLPYSKLLPPESRQQLELEEITIPEMLKPAGYVSAHIGKWHLGPAPYWPEKQGFDVNVGGTNSGMPKSFFYPEWKGNPPIEGKPGEYLTDRLTDEALQFIERHKDRPFFLYLAHYAVHVPIEAKAELAAKYRNKVKPGQLQNDPVYAAMIESMDQSVGRVMQLLERHNLTDSTLIIFTSDNGGLSAPEWKLKPVTSNAPLREGKGHLYEGGIREPLIIAGAGLKPRVVNTPVCSIDFLPTIAEFARVSPPQGIDGVSLMPLLTGAGELRPRKLYWHYPHYSNQLGKPGGAVRDGDYKLIEFYEDGHLELYNLREDMGESRDLSRKLPEKAAAMRRTLDEWRRSVSARMPAPNPNYNPSRAQEGYWWRTTGALPR